MAATQKNQVKQTDIERTAYEKFEDNVRETIFNILYVLLKNEENSKVDITVNTVIDMIQIYSFTFSTTVIFFQLTLIASLPLGSTRNFVLSWMVLQCFLIDNIVQLHHIFDVPDNLLYSYLSCYSSYPGHFLCCVQLSTQRIQVRLAS